LVAQSGVGKTSIAFGALENAGKKGLNSLLFSLDMHRNLVFQKLIQRCSGVHQDDIFAAFKNKDVKQIEYMKGLVRENFSKTFMDFSGMLSLEDIENKVDQTEQDNGVKIDLVVIDYASRLSSHLTDRFQSECYNAIKSKDSADKTNAAFIILTQVSRASGNGATALRSKSVVKNSSDWEQSASNVLTAWRPFLGLHEHYCEEYDRNFEDKYMRMFMAKSRMGEELEVLLKWNGAAGKVTELTESELQEYNKYIKPMESKAFKYLK
jgi:replicative DNA helicase